MPINEINKEDVQFEEYYKSLLWENDLDKKLDFIAKNVLSYGFDNKNADCTLEEMIAISKFQFLETSSEKRLTYKIANDEDGNFKLPNDLINPYGTNKEYLNKEKEFIKNPVTVLKEYAIAEADKEIDNNNLEQIFWKKHCEEMIKKLRNIEKTYNNDEKKINPKITTLLINRTRYSGEAKTYEAILDKNKGGFFERLFRTTSNEYNNFKNTFKAYNDKNNKLYGNKEALRTAALAYIKHKFPNLKDDEEPDYNIADNLKGTSLNRTMLCLTVLEKLKYQEEIEKLNETFNNPTIENEQKDFQKDLGNDIEDKLEVQASIDDINNEPIKENEISNE